MSRSHQIIRAVILLAILGGFAVAISNVVTAPAPPEVRPRVELLTRANALKLAIEPGWDEARLQAEITAEEAFRAAHLPYQAQLLEWKRATERHQTLKFNARCCNQRCGQFLHLTGNHPRTTCRRCGANFSTRLAKALFVPPPPPAAPEPPRRNRFSWILGS